METRTFKWRHRRVELDAERQRFATKLLDLGEDLMKIHSEVEKRAFDKLMGDPIRCINSWFER